MTSTQGKTVGALVIAGLTIIGIGTYVAVNDTGSESSEKVATTPTYAINISSTGEVPLTFQMSTATVDICYIGNPQKPPLRERNLLVEPWLSQQKALGFNRACVFADGSIAQVSHIAMPPAIGKGYNGNPADFNYDMKEYAEAMGGALVADWKTDFFPNTVAFVKALGIPCDVTLNKRDSWEVNKYRIDQTGAEYIFLWSEVKILDSETWQGYLTWCQQMRDSVTKYYGTSKKLIADQPNLFQNDKKSVAWRANINPTSLTGIFGADVYWQVDDQVHYTANQDSNIIRSRLYMDSIMPAQINQFRTLFPGWQMVCGQTQLEDRREPNILYITNTIVGDITWGGLYETFIENQSIEPMAIQETMKNCSDPANPTTQILTLLNSTLKPGRNVTSLSFTGMPDCTGYSLRWGDPKKNHCVVINNWSRATYTLSEIMFDGKRKTPVVTAIHHTSLSWRDAIVIDTTVSETFSIPPGVTVLNYTLK